MVSPGVHPDRPLTSHGKRAERAEIGGPGEFDHLTDDELERAWSSVWLGSVLRWCLQSATDQSRRMAQTRTLRDY
jgi:hypothetical protein